MAARKPGKVGWGIMSTALIGTRAVIPAMMRSNKFEFPAIPPRDQKRADKAAKALGIPVAHGSYSKFAARCLRQRTSRRFLSSIPAGS